MQFIKNSGAENRSVHTLAMLLALAGSACSGSSSTESTSTSRITTTPTSTSYTATDTPLALSPMPRSWGELESSISVSDALSLSGVFLDLHATVPPEHTTITLHSPSGDSWKIKPKALGTGEFKESFSLPIRKRAPSRGLWKLRIRSPMSPTTAVHAWTLKLTHEPALPGFDIEASPKEAEIIGPSDLATFDINVGSTFGFSDEVELTWTSRNNRIAHPNLDADIKLSATTVVPGSSAVMSIKTHTDTAPGKYIVTVVATSNGTAKSVDLILIVDNKALASYESQDTPQRLSETVRFWGELESKIVVPDGITVSDAVVELHATVPHDNASIYLRAPSGQFWSLKPKAKVDGEVREKFRLELPNEPGRGLWKLEVRAPLRPTSTVHSWTLRLAHEPLPPGFDIEGSPKEAEIIGPSDLATFDINVGSTFGFSDEVELTWTSRNNRIAHPNLDADIKLSATTVVPGSSAVMSIKTHTDTAPGKYIVTVVATSNGTAKSVDLILIVDNKALASYESQDTPQRLSETVRFWGELESKIVVPDGITVSDAVVELHATVPHDNASIYLRAPSGQFWSLKPKAKVDGEVREKFRLELSNEPGRGLWKLEVRAPLRPTSTVHSWTLRLAHEPLPPGFDIEGSPNESEVAGPSDLARFTIDVGSTFGFSEKVALTWTAQPSLYADVNLTTNPVTPGSSTVMRVKTHADTAPGRYIINVAASSKETTKSVDLVLMVDNKAMATYESQDTPVQLWETSRYSGRIESEIVVPDDVIATGAVIDFHATLQHENSSIDLFAPSGTWVWGGKSSKIGETAAHETFRLKFADEPAAGPWKVRVLSPSNPVSTLHSWTLKLITGPLSPDNATIASAGTTGRRVNHAWSPVSFTSPFEATPILVAAMQSTIGFDPAGLRIRNHGAMGFEVMVEEENSTADGITHTLEEVGYLALAPGPIVNQAGKIIGEAGSVNRGHSTAAEDWHRIEYKHGAYLNPVVIMNMTTTNGIQPAHVRLRNVKSTSDSGLASSFEFKIEEWEYLDGRHNVESLSYAVIEEGTHSLANAQQIVAAMLPVDNTTDHTNPKWNEVAFSSRFAATPIVFSQVQTNVEGEAVVTRQSNINASGFSIQMQEEKGSDGQHDFETIGYIAVGAP